MTLSTIGKLAANAPVSMLTVRGQIAAMALQGLLANPQCIEICKEAGMVEQADEFYALIAVEHADALINELNK